MRVILIKLGHVEIVDKVNKLLLAWWAELLAGYFFQELLQLDLEIAGVSVIRKIDQLIVIVLGELFDDVS